MDAEIFVNRIMDALENDDIWIFLVRNIIMDCSDSFLDYVEEIKELVIGRDIKNFPFHSLTTTRAVERRTEEYKLFFVGQLSGIGKRANIKPCQYKDYRFTITLPVNESKIHPPETKQIPSSLEPPLEGT